MKKKIFAFATVVFLLLFLVGGCGSQTQACKALKTDLDRYTKDYNTYLATGTLPGRTKEQQATLNIAYNPKYLAEKQQAYKDACG